MAHTRTSSKRKAGLPKGRSRNKTVRKGKGGAPKARNSRVSKP
jgi:hypothetical protein